MLSPTRADTIEERDRLIYNPEGCEVNVALHCNLSCRGCSHLSPLFAKSFVDPRQVEHDLSALAHVYRASYVKLLGGEPLLHPDLIGVIDAVRRSGVADRVLVCTNGLLLGRMHVDFWNAVDEVEVSLYPRRRPAESVLERAAAEAESAGVRLRLVTVDNFRDPYASMGTEDQRLVRDIFSTCKPAHVWRCHTVHEGYFYRCPQSVFTRSILDPESDPGLDGVCIDRPDLSSALRTYLEGTEPLSSCRSCLGSVGKLRSHSQVPRGEWEDCQAHTTEDLVDYEFLTKLLSNPAADDGCVTSTRELGCR